MPQRGQRGSGIALGEQDGTLRVGGHGTQERRADVAGDLRQLVGGGACRRDVAAASTISTNAASTWDRAARPCAWSSAVRIAATAAAT